MPVKDNKDARRFELHIEDQTVFANYKIDESTLYINYVESPDVLRGTGAASELMKGIAELAREKHLKIVPICSYAVSWLNRHKDYQDVLA